MWQDPPAQGTVYTRAATATGSGTGTIPTGMTRINVTSANADYIIKLPAPQPGTLLILSNGTTGYELRSNAPATVGIQAGVGAAAESAVPASATVWLYCKSTTNWVGFYVTATALTFVEVAA